MIFDQNIYSLPVRSLPVMGRVDLNSWVLADYHLGVKDVEALFRPMMHPEVAYIVQGDRKMRITDVKDWETVKRLLKRDNPPPSPLPRVFRTVSTQARPEEWDMLAFHARNAGMSVSALARTIIKQWMEEHPPALAGLSRKEENARDNGSPEDR